MFPQFKIQVNAALEYLRFKLSEKTTSKKQESTEDDGEKDQSEEEQVDSKEELKTYTIDVGEANGISFKVKLPLIYHPRAGMCCENLLLFTNGRKTFLFDPINWKYYGDTQMLNLTDSIRRKELMNGFCGEMPILKNPEAYTTSSGDIYLVGGKLIIFFSTYYFLIIVLGLELDKTVVGAMKRKIYLFRPDTMRWKVCESHPHPRCMAAYADCDDEFYILGKFIATHIK